MPGYAGRFRAYFSWSAGGTNLPPRKWYRPVKCIAAFLGAVREMSMSGWRPSAFPFSTSQPATSPRARLQLGPPWLGPFLWQVQL